LQFPNGSSAAVVKGDVLVAIVSGYLEEIAKSINKNITSVQTLLTKITTTTDTATVPTEKESRKNITSVHTPVTKIITTTATATVATEKEESDIKRYIIAGCIAGVVVFLVLFVLIAWRCSVRRR